MPILLSAVLNEEFCLYTRFVCINKIVLCNRHRGPIILKCQGGVKTVLNMTRIKLFVVEPTLVTIEQSFTMLKFKIDASKRFYLESFKKLKILKNHIHTCGCESLIIYVHMLKYLHPQHF